ncbi:hydrogenase accessory protein HypB [archaeon SCG-AAA382B04]|nr:hydrogenase accessory protein HypB [archaeon SCG-AAA382B04]
MHEIENVDVETDLIEENEKEAKEINDFLGKNNIRSIDIVGAIGSGKTSLIEEFSCSFDNVGAIVGDVAGEDDYNRLVENDVPTVNLNTGKECHLDAHLVKHALSDLPIEEIDYLFFENVGNLVCPADFMLGADERWIVVSVTEGDDVVNKHPIIFKNSDVTVINKIDLAEAIGADLEKMVEDAREINPDMDVIKTSIKTGEGLDRLKIIVE